MSNIEFSSPSNDKKLAGEKKPGRPVDPTSKRQQREAELEAKRERGELTLGRPPVPNSKRQQELLEKALKKAVGEPVQKGRPKMTEEEKVAARELRTAQNAEARRKWLEKNGGNLPQPAIVDVAEYVDMGIVTPESDDVIMMEADDIFEPLPVKFVPHLKRTHSAQLNILTPAIIDTLELVSELPAETHNDAEQLITSTTENGDVSIDVSAPLETIFELEEGAVAAETTKSSKRSKRNR